MIGSLFRHPERAGARKSSFDGFYEESEKRGALSGSLPQKGAVGEAD